MPNRLLTQDTQTNVITGAQTNTAVNLDNSSGYSAMVLTTNTSPVAKLFASTAVSTAADTATITAHPYVTGVVGQLTTTGGLPAGLSTSTNYFIIVVDANTVKFAASLANALAGTAIDLTTQGSGNDTFTPTVASGCTCKLQLSNDNVNWVDLASATAITIGTPVMIRDSAPRIEYRYVKAVFALAAGQVSTTVQTIVKE